MAVNVFPSSTDHGQQSGQACVVKEQNSTPNLPAPNLLFEASDRFFGVVYNDVMQDTSCSSSYDCINISTLESATNTKMSKCKNAKIQQIATNVGTSKSSKCTSKTAVNIQQCKDELQGGAAEHQSPNFDSEACVKKSTHF